MLVKPIYKTMCLRKTSLPGRFCTRFIITVRRPFWQFSFGYRFQASFSKVVAILENTNVFFALLLIIQARIHIRKKRKQNTGNVSLLACSNYYFIKLFCCVLPPGSQVYSPLYYTCILYIYRLLIRHNNVTDSKSTKNFNFE